MSVRGKSRVRRQVPFLPLTQRVEVYVPGAVEYDRFGNPRPIAGRWESVMVAAWWVHSTEESEGDSVLRTTDMLTIHADPSTPISPAGKVRLPDGGVWEVEGNPEDYNHGPFGFVPGLVAYHCKKVEG